MKDIIPMISDPKYDKLQIEKARAKVKTRMAKAVATVSSKGVKHSVAI